MRVLLESNTENISYSPNDGDNLLAILPENVNHNQPDDGNIQEDSEPEDEEEKRIRKTSLIHPIVYGGNGLFIYFDLETGGDYCGIVQISAECFTIDPKADKGGGERLSNTFDAYVKPPNDAVWSKFATNIHGLHKN